METSREWANRAARAIRLAHARRPRTFPRALCSTCPRWHFRRRGVRLGPGSV